MNLLLKLILLGCMINIRRISWLKIIARLEDKFSDNCCGYVIMGTYHIVCSKFINHSPEYSVEELMWIA